MYAMASLSFGSDPYYTQNKGGCTVYNGTSQSRIIPPTPDEIAQRFIYGYSQRARAKEQEREKGEKTENRKAGKIAFITAAMYFR